MQRKPIITSRCARDWRRALTRQCLLLSLSLLLVSACSDSGTTTTPPIRNDDAVVNPPQDTTEQVPADPAQEPTFPEEMAQLPIRPELYQQAGYAQLNVIRMDVTTRTSPGVCTENDLSGCTLADVLADTNASDNFKVDIAVHFKADDFADDGSFNNALMRQRGGGARTAPQKSFRIRLDDKDSLWRGERHLQLNKHPFDSTRIRNKLSFDLMRSIPHLPSFRTQFVNLWIDDGQGPVDQGLYTHIERGDERYLKRRELDADGNLYKAQLFHFLPLDLESLKVDATGQPLDPDAFEAVLEIEHGDDHRPLYSMLEALDNPAISFESFLTRYFDENNVLTWAALNLLIGQLDAVYHNYFLYKPGNSERFYFLPWDYDLAFERQRMPANSLDNDALQQRLRYGYAGGVANRFIDRLYRLPGMHQRILSKANELRANHLTDTRINTHAAALNSLAAPFSLRNPDRLHNPSYVATDSLSFSTTVKSNHEALQNQFAIPLPPTLQLPRLLNNQWIFAWRAAHSMTGDSLSYELQIASQLDFAADSIILTETHAPLSAAAPLTLSIAAQRIPSGQHYARLIARAAMQPEQNWQVADNVIISNETRHVGVIAFDVP